MDRSTAAPHVSARRLVSHETSKLQLVAITSHGPHTPEMVRVNAVRREAELRAGIPCPLQSYGRAGGMWPTHSLSKKCQGEACEKLVQRQLFLSCASRQVVFQRWPPISHRRFRARTQAMKPRCVVAGLLKRSAARSHPTHMEALISIGTRVRCVSWSPGCRSFPNWIRRQMLRLNWFRCSIRWNTSNGGCLRSSPRRIN
jgi:hypothetical protein